MAEKAGRLFAPVCFWSFPSLSLLLQINIDDCGHPSVVGPLDSTDSTLRLTHSTDLHPMVGRMQIPLHLPMHLPVTLVF